jgi:hypothetical protein
MSSNLSRRSLLATLFGGAIVPTAAIEPPFNENDDDYDYFSDMAHAYEDYINERDQLDIDEKFSENEKTHVMLIAEIKRLWKQVASLQDSKPTDLELPGLVIEYDSIPVIPLDEQVTYVVGAIREWGLPLARIGNCHGADLYRGELIAEKAMSATGIKCTATAK